MVVLWNETTCHMLAINGRLDCLRYCTENVCPGVEIRVDMQLNMDVWIVYAMHMRTVVLGMKIRVDIQLNMDVWIVYAKHMRMVVLG